MYSKKQFNTTCTEILSAMQKALVTTFRKKLALKGSAIKDNTDMLGI